LRRHDHAAGAHHRLGDERGDRLRVFPPDQVFELVRQPHGEGFFALTRVRTAVMVRTGRVQNPRDRQVEIQVIVG
jgi:hypothetical protein